MSAPTTPPVTSNDMPKTASSRPDGFMVLGRPWVIPASSLWNIVIFIASLTLSLSVFADMQNQEIILSVNGEEATETIVQALADVQQLTVVPIQTDDDTSDTAPTEITIDSPILSTRVEQVRRSDNPEEIRNNVFVVITSGDDSVGAVRSYVSDNFGANISNIRNVPEFFNLGTPVQTFAAFVALLPATLAFFMTFFLWLSPTNPRANTGRYIGITMYLAGFVLSLATLANQWGLYTSFELLVDGIMTNGQLTLGFALAYAIFWVAGRFDETSVIAGILERVALGLAGLTLIALLLLSNILDGFSFILGTYSQPTTIIITLVVIIFGGLGLRLLMSSDYFNETPDQRTAWQGWLMLSPNIIGFMLFFAGPLLLSFYLSFTNSAVGTVPDFIGFDNYAEIMSMEIVTQEDTSQPAQSALTIGYTVLGTFDSGDSRLVIGAKDALFWISLRNTLVFCFLLIPLAIVPALTLSLVLNSKLPGMKFFRAIYFLPSVAAVVGTALIWRWLYNPSTGYYNYVISNSVEWLNSTFGWAIADPQLEWLTDPSVVMFSMVFLAAWGLVGYNTVLFLAGLQGIPGTLYEAAMIDGANRWQQFRNVTLPMLAPTTFFVVITTIVTGLQVFNEPYTLFPLQPIPENATTSVYYLYRRGFFFFEFGYASSIAWVLFLIIFSITLVQFRLQRGGAYND
jgi:ABC-type sugar transport system permease subunit